MILIILFCAVVFWLAGLAWGCVILGGLFLVLAVGANVAGLVEFIKEKLE
jgi:hypothetical protein